MFDFESEFLQRSSFMSVLVEHFCKVQEFMEMKMIAFLWIKIGLIYWCFYAIYTAWIFLRKKKTIVKNVFLNFGFLMVIWQRTHSYLDLKRTVLFFIPYFLELWIAAVYWRMVAVEHLIVVTKMSNASLVVDLSLIWKTCWSILMMFEITVYLIAQRRKGVSVLASIKISMIDGITACI